MSPSKPFQNFFRNLFSLDFFSVKPSERLTFDKNLFYSTLLGKIFSWIIVGLTVIIFVNFGQNMIYHKNPFSIVSAIVTQDPAYLNLKENGFFLTFGLQDLRNNAAHFIDETIYTVELIQRTKIGQNMSLIYLPVGRCSVDMVPNQYGLKDFYSEGFVNDLYCFYNSSEEFALQSAWEGPVYKNILINIVTCKNSTTNNNKCKSVEIIEEYMNNGNFAMYFNTLAVDPNNYENPIEVFVRDVYTPISYSMSNYIEMFFGHINFQTDNGFLLEDLQNFKQATYVSDRQLLTFNSDVILQVDIKLDKILTTYIRKYDKIQTVLANIGGIVKALMIVANFMVSPLINLNFKLTLANKMFDFKTSKKSKKSKKIPKKDVLNLSNPTTNSTKTTRKIKANFIKKEDIVLPKDDEDKHSLEKLKISYLQYSITCCQNQVSNIYKKILNQGLNPN